MEADWAAEIGPDLPVICVPWEGFTDLRQSVAGIHAIQEAVAHPALREALVALNASASPVFTAKCDLWRLSQSELDPDEFDSSIENALYGTASYIDIVRHDLSAFSSFELHERWVRDSTRDLHSIAVQNSRVEYVLRPALVDKDSGFGLTLYAAGCGATPEDGYRAWGSALSAAVTATINTAALSSHPGE
jgi:hypothetical protein